MNTGFDKPEGRPQGPLARRMPSGRGKKQAGVTFDPKTLAKLNECARKKGLSRSWVLNLAVTESMEQRERRERGEG